MVEERGKGDGKSQCTHSNTDIYRQSPVKTPDIKTSKYCFDTAFTSDVTAQLNSRERGGAPDTKNPDLYYYHVQKHEHSMWRKTIQK